MSQFPKSLLIVAAIIIVLVVGLGAYSVRKLGGAYQKTENRIMEDE